MVEDARRGYRRVVPSPRPVKIIEIDTVRDLLSLGEIVITVGGGGIPVIEEADGTLSRVATVIDRDLAAQKLTLDINAGTLLILTSVGQVALDYGTPKQRFLDAMKVGEAKRYMSEGHFAPGSMLPKVEAAMRFVEARAGGKAIIAEFSQAVEALAGRAGTRITLH